MKKTLSTIVLLCFLVAALGLTTIASGLVKYDEYTLSGTFDGAAKGDIVSVFVLKDGYTMQDLSAGSVIDKVYYTNMTAADNSGRYSFNVMLPEGVSRSTQCVVACNGVKRQDTLRSFLISGGSLVVIYAAPGGSSGANGSKEKPYTLRNAINQAVSKAKTADVEILMYGGKYSYENTRIQFTQSEVFSHNITFAPASESDKPVVTSMKTVNHKYITKLTEGDIYNRIPEKARGMVYKLDMIGAGFAHDVPIVSSTTGETTGYYSVLSMNYSDNVIEPPILYLNGKRQRMSQYPNEATVAFDGAKGSTGKDSSGYSTLTYYEASKGNFFGTSSVSIDFTDKMDFAKWENALLEDAYVAGYVFDSFRAAVAKITKVEETADKGTIYTTTTRKVTFDTTQDLYYPNSSGEFGPRLAIVNLPEEMDIPGEYYFCTADKCIYYYAPYELTADDVFEMANDRRSNNNIYGYPQLVHITSSKNITFDGIEFYGSRYDNAIYVSRSENIVFKNCTIHATADLGMSLSGTNILVENCNIYDTGGAGISIGGGVPYRTDVSTPSNNMVRNCHVYNYAQNPTKGFAATGIKLGSSNSETVDGVTTYYKSLGDTAENNLIHASKYAGGLRAAGLGTNVTRNEIYNLLQSADDIGAVYIGRSVIEFGNYFTENYIHDFHTIKNPRYATMGIYWDDYQSGQTATRNIIVGPGTTGENTVLLGIRTIGYDNEIRNNTFVDIYSGIGLSGRSPSSWTSQNAEHGFYSSLQKGIAAEGYPERDRMIAFRDRLAENEGATMIHMARAINNVTADCVKGLNISSSTDGRIYEYGDDNVYGNIIDATKSVFVNPEKQDYRVRKEYIADGAYAEVPNEENFDMGWIGIQNLDNMPESDTGFKLMHPTKGETLTNDNVVLSWEQGLFADKYEYVIATDKDFANVIETGETAETFAIPTTTFTEGTTYYWKVKAVNTSLNMGRTWSCNKVESFTVAKKANLETIEGTVLTEDATTIIRTLNDVQNFDLKYTVKNNGTDTQDFVVIAALFSDKGKFQQAKVSETATIEKGKTITGTFEFYCSTPSKDGYYVKLFVVDQTKTLKPLSFFSEVLKKQ